MKRSLLVITVILFICILVLGGCKTPDTSITVPASTDESDIDILPETFTLLIYLCGSDLESRSGKASANIAEMQEAEIDKNINVVVQTGGSTSWKDIEVSAQSTDRFLIKTGGKQMIDRITVKRNFGDSKTLSEFIEFGVERYPADKYGLILWNHGAGSVKGVCFDANFGYDGLTLSEIKEALESTKEIIGKKFEFIGLDACLMATYDMACIIEPYADYMIASQEIQPSSGWDYKRLISNLGKETFYADVLNSYAEKQAQKNIYTLSAVKLSELSKAEAVIDELINQINCDLSYVGVAIEEGKEFGVKGISRSTNLFDLGLLAESLGIEYDFSDFIINVNGNAHSTATGISIYFPTEQKELLDTYSDICTNKRYIDFLKEYFAYQPETAIAFTNRGYSADGSHLSFTLSKQSISYVQSVGYELHSYAGSEQTGKLYSVGTDNDISLSDGIYTVDFDGRWVYLNDMLLHCDVYQEEDTYTVFSSRVLVNGESASLLFTYSGSTKQIAVDGYILSSDTSSRIYELKPGTKISILYKDALSDDDAPYYEEGAVIWGEDT
ncbi:MAG TPA: clostripain-related cysteine peptidase, partial [Clostridia bacterium]|nr:clostripain-related cysteine peptidase [Clostridia bacterium]